MNSKGTHFNTIDNRRLPIEQIVNEIIGFMKEDPNRSYKIILGTDSKIGSDLTADFVTAIVVHRIGNGGRYFWRRIDPIKKFHTLRDRIWEEVLISMEAAKQLFNELEKMSAPKHDFEIHVDIGNFGETKVLIQEVTGMIRATQFVFKTKPESYAASKVADRHT